MALAKPQIRHLLTTSLKRDFIGCGIFVTAVGLWYRYGLQIPKRKKYEEYYKNFDSEKEFLRQREVGVFQCVKPGGEIQTGY